MALSNKVISYEALADLVGVGARTPRARRHRQAKPAERKPDEQEQATKRHLDRLVAVAFPDADKFRRRDIIVDLVAVLQRHRDTMP